MARFDRAIPPGGEGKVTVKIDLKGFRNNIKKTATLESNDSLSPKTILTMEGVVRPLIDVQPEPLVSFRKNADASNEKTLDLVTASEPFHIIKVANGLEGKVSYQLETVQDGKHYRIKVSNLLSQGQYAGALTIYTDMDRKKEFNIYVRAILE